MANLPQSIIPATYEGWVHCITYICRIELTEDFINQRLLALNDFSDHMTSRFVELYGEQQRQRTLQWLARAYDELR